MLKIAMLTADVASHTASRLARLTKDGSPNGVYFSYQRRKNPLVLPLSFEMKLDSGRKASMGYASTVRDAKVFLSDLWEGVGKTWGFGVRDSNVNDVNYYSSPFPVISYGL
jgi:hypothetical protein